MAGGKETPRQKMIGMMYLVLTALLALNVSKAILDAFVAIEENIQVANINEYGRGEEKRLDLKEVSEDKSAPDVQKKAANLMKFVKQIDEITAKEIKFIDDLKLEILEKCGENTKEIGEGKLIEKMYDSKDPIRPTRMKLMHVDGKDKYDEPMGVVGIAEDIKNPTGKGKELWEGYMKYRKDLTELIAKSSSTPEKAYTFKDPNIVKFKEDGKDLATQLDKHMKGVAPDDVEALKKIYGALSKNERADMHEGEIKDVHWVGRTFDHSPSVAALASLSSMQKEILTARADAIALIRSRVGGGEYSFNKIMPLAYGPDIANAGDEITLEVLMAAYDSDKQPTVKPNQGTLKETKDGKGYVTVKASGTSNMELTGSITILNKSGIGKTLNYSKTVKIMKPEGTVSLPDLQVLYRKYENKVVGLASGFPETKLSGVNVSLTRKGAFYVASPGAGKTATISVSGYNELTKKTASLGTFTFSVRNLPDAQVYWGKNGQGIKAADKGFPVLTAGYGEGIPLTVPFSVAAWKLQIEGIDKTYTGSGGRLSDEALKVLRLARSGKSYAFSVDYIGAGSKKKASFAGTL